MTIGFFVEGPKSEKPSITILARKVLESKSMRRGVVARVGGGDLFNAQKMKVHINTLLRIHQDITKIIVCVDSDCNPSEAEGRAKSTERQLASFRLKTVPRYVLVIHALEGWLAADPEAVGKVVGADVPRHIPQDLEGVCKPADLLDQIFAKYGKDFRKTQHGPLIAGYADPAAIAHRNSSFRQCQEAIIDP